jgi:osmotically-inducible protein OsmY
MYNYFQKHNSELKSDILSELKWDPSVTFSEIGVSVDNGIVTLNGTVPHYSEKSSAVKAAQRVSGVRAVADELHVKLVRRFERGDADIAQAALNSLQWNYSVPDGVMVSVEGGQITLRGEVEWDYERVAAKDAVCNLMGVKGVTNEIILKDMTVKPMVVKARIEAAIKRSSENDSKNINVSVEGNHVTLSGKVRSISEMQEARLAAWNSPGVALVSDTLKVSA